MTAIDRIHDRIVQLEGIDCTCPDRGCPAMAAAVARHRRELSSQGQLELGDTARTTGPMTGDDWGGFGE